MNQYYPIFVNQYNNYFSEICYWRYKKLFFIRVFQNIVLKGSTTPIIEKSMLEFFFLEKIIYRNSADQSYALISFSVSNLIDIKLDFLPIIRTMLSI